MKENVSGCFFPEHSVYTHKDIHKISTTSPLVYTNMG